MRIIAYMESVNFSDYQRLDTIDQAAIQELTYQYISRALGGLLGGGFGGAISPIYKTNWAAGAEYFMSIGKSTFAFTDSNGTQQGKEVQTESKIVQFNPADTGHSNYPIDFTAERAIASAASWNYFPYIWARPIEYSTNVDSRRFWDTGAEVEINNAAYETRTVTRVEFYVAETEPVGDGWSRIARVSDWLGGNNILGPLILTEFWFDSPATYTYLGLSNEDETRYSDTAGLDFDDLTAVDSLPRTLGILHHLLLLRRQTQRINSFGQEDPGGVTATDWDARPLLSLNGAYVEIQDLKGDVSDHESQLNDQFVAASASILVTPDPDVSQTGTVTITHGRGVSSVTIAPEVDFILLAEISKPSWLTSPVWQDAYITSIQITELYDSDSQGATDAKFPIRILPYTPAADIQVSDYLNGDGLMEFEIRILQDEDQDGVWKPVRGNLINSTDPGVDGFVWADFDPFRFTVVVHCSLNEKEA